MIDAPSFRAPVLAGCLALAVLILGFGLWSVTAQLASAIVVTGRVETDQSRLMIQHPDGGLVQALHVTEGQAVAAGTLLLSLDGSALRSDLGIVEGRLRDLAAQELRLIAERDGAEAMAIPAELAERMADDAELAARVAGQAALFVARRATLAELRLQMERRIDQVRAHMHGLAAQNAALGRELALLRADLTDRQGLLDRGLTTRERVRPLEREALRLSGQIAELDAAIAGAEAQITEIGIQIASLALRRQEEAETALREIEPQRLELEERRRALLDRIARLDLRAPVAGTVLGLQVPAAGSVLRPAEPALGLVPAGRPVVVTAQLSPAERSRVRPGQPVEVMVLTPEARAMPHLAGTLSRISPDTLADPVTGRAHFVIRVELLPGETDRLGIGAPGPGIPVQVMLQTGTRTPLAYLWDPFGAYFSRALREG